MKDMHSYKEPFRDHSFRGPWDKTKDEKATFYYLAYQLGSI